MTAPLEFSSHALVLQYTVASGQAVTAGEAVVLASDTTVQDAGGHSDLVVGIGASSASAGAQVDIIMFGHAVVPVLVGTGGATRGTKAKPAADGFTDCTAHDSDGTGNESSYGIFLQSGSATNWVGLLLGGAANRGV